MPTMHRRQEMHRSQRHARLDESYPSEFGSTQFSTAQLTDEPWKMPTTAPAGTLSDDEIDALWEAAHEHAAEHAAAARRKPRREPWFAESPRASRAIAITLSVAIVVVAGVLVFGQ